ncbi:MAG: hypothetical protein IJL41_04265 [Clostridia bacterium]|nr:hypothetical protein [Clostridia bacterium]
MEKSYKMIKERREYPDGNGNIRVISSVTLPEFSESDGVFAEVNAFYGEMREQFDSFCRKKLFKRACAGGSSLPYGAVMTSRVTYADEEFVSVAVDSRVFDGEKSGISARVPQTWNVRDGKLETVRAFLSARERAAAYENICAQIGEKRGSGVPFCRRSAERKVRSRFTPRSFYLVPGGAAFCFEAGVLTDSPFPEVFTVKYADIGK